ncbi:peptidoglycan-binding protein [Actinoplanes sp. TBRC 11911]|uniref:peptidoglycan-binding domain-containing protein n=1 Tax=Actinoplanes sp. TBRC 11911 TaxID=2729386 RepID=UPI00145F3980|nr:peptidoglycan-binding protein [Actinoplanes sp. TBRC 11911]NMO55678.1 peptidoglycan-binding protein [Actinoplanes sp. TBRC 11911]
MATTLNLNPFPEVRQGDKNHPVKTVQDLLNAQGFTVDVDGEFGPQTQQAVRDFQTTRSLSVDGIVGPATWPALVIQVRQGDEGDAVRGVQEELDFRDPKGPKVDGEFGPATDAAVRAFQQSIGAKVSVVKVDGIVGVITWQALVGNTSAE